MADENKTTKSILEYLELLGWVCWRHNQIAVRGRKFTGRKGVSDIVALEPNGSAWFIEVKNPDEEAEKPRPGKLSKDQEEFRDDVRKAGHVYVTVYSFDQFLDAMDIMGIKKCDSL